MNGTCNSGLTQNGTCACATGWTTSTSASCDSCVAGGYGSTCSGVCPNCGQGRCSSGVTGNGVCTCQTGWANNGTSFCSVCASGYALSGGQCQSCYPSCQNCTATTATSCTSCVGALVYDLTNHTCTSNCSTGLYLNGSSCVGEWPILLSRDLKLQTNH